MAYDLPLFKTCVVVEPSGRVFVNDVLCAVVTVGGRTAGGGPMVVKRDDLAHRLRLDGCAQNTLDTLDVAIRYLDRTGLASGTVDADFKRNGVKVTRADYSDFGIGLVEALTGQALTQGSQQREAGTRTGQMLRAMRDRLTAELGTNEVAAGGPGQP